ncbi:MAG: hypothetical protein V1800_09450 [Candidatus Latescibacterota bacterium]
MKSNGEMPEALLLQELESVAERLDLAVGYGSLEGKGGLCRYGGATHLILNQSLSVSERVEAFLCALRRLDLDAVFLRPRIREMIEGTGTRKGSDEIP